MVTKHVFWRKFFRLFVFGHFFCPISTFPKYFPGKKQDILYNIFLEVLKDKCHKNLFLLGFFRGGCLRLAYLRDRFICRFREEFNTIIIKFLPFILVHGGNFPKELWKLYHPLFLQLVGSTNKGAREVDAHNFWNESSEFERGASDSTTQI